MRYLNKLLCYLGFHKYILSHEGLQGFFDCEEIVHHRCLFCQKETQQRINWNQ